MKHALKLLLFALPLWAGNLFAQLKNWPKEILFKTGGGKVLIYQPQPDALVGNLLTGRAAIGGKEKAADELVFGAIFFEAKLITDKATRKATLEDFKITNAKVTGLEDEAKIAKLTALIENEVPNWNMDLSIDELVATIKKDHPNAEVYNNTPPKMYYRNKPTSLVILDGEPKIQKDKDLDADRVVNSPNLIFKEGTQWNMYEGGIWYKSASVTSGWTAEKTMSKKVKSINDQIKKQEKEANNGKDLTEKPVATDIIVSTVPAELIQTEGAPSYKPIDSTSLQYVTNTKNDIIKTADGQIFVLVAGRWFKSMSFEGPWTFNESDKLPADFSKIPEGSAKDNVLVSVSGTNAAEEAMIDAEIPQTAKVDRKTATAKVEYDGDPKFETIEGTTLQLAANASLTVLKEASGSYFLLDNGVWFISSAAKGPWKVADRRPEGVDAIPAKSAAYNTKFVYIYEATPTYVVVGYTGGYLGTYIQGDPTIIFGTGFYYAPWYGSIYYPRPTTWGFNFGYNPWTGWTMGFGFNIGFMHIGFSFGGGYGYGGGGWFGPPYYRPPYRPPYYGGGGYYGRPGYGRPGGGNNININTGGGDINIGGNHNNIYNRPGNGNGNNNGGNRPGIASRPDNNGRPGSNYRPGNNNSNNRPGNNNNNNGGIGNNNNNGNRPGNNSNNNGGIGNNNNGNRPGNNNNNGGGFGNNKSAAKPSISTPNNVFADKDGNVYQKDRGGNVQQRDNKSNSWKAPSNPAATNNIQRDAQNRDRSSQRNQSFNQSKARPSAPSARPSTMPASRPSGGGGGGGGRKRG
jgi:hypothetical protein